MKSPRFSQRPRATALVVVLSCVVIMSILLISYLVAMQLDRQSTQNYAQGIKARELAEGALQEILGDLRREINAGSLQDATPAGASYTTNAIRIYTPSTNTTIAPARFGFTTAEFSNLPPTLIRVSRAADPFFTAPPAGYLPALLPTNHASAVASTLPSANKRFVSADRWNRTLLMGTNVPTVFSNKPPDWIYITRAGSKTLTVGDIPAMKMSTDLTKTNTVLGRYSYVIYEQGGLLDLNTAGYPSSALSETDGTNAIAGRGFTAYADLSRLPGLNPAAVDQIINWRSLGSLNAQSGKFLPATLTNATTGFLKFQAGDSPLLGRQDLINYFKQTPSLSTNLAALSYLGTFSRSLNAPSWKPSSTVGAPTGNTINYAGQAETSTSPNRNIPNVRFRGAGTITHYDDAGNQSSYAVKAGDPLIQRRFSLAKIAWLTPSGPQTGKAQAIQDCFGLRWNSSQWRWDYVGPTGSSVQTGIDTLEEVASQNREPNFFELLKAGILSGSLGRDPGSSNRSVSHGFGPYVTAPGVLGSFFENYSASPNLQILKIGSNIIDQADEDGYPTALYLRAFNFSSSPIDDLAFTTVYGVENLPYLTRVGAIAVADPAPTVSNDPNARIKFWVQPEIWNPHQPPPSRPDEAPTKFRAYAYGDAQGMWWYRNGPANFGNPVYYDDGAGGGANRAEGAIYFSDSGDTSSPFYNNPRLLTTDLVDTGNTPAANLWKPTYAGLPDDQGGQNLFAAFATGDADYPINPIPYNILAPDWRPHIDKCVTGNTTVYYSLQYEDSDGNWRPYNFMARITRNPDDPQNGVLAVNGYRMDGAIVWGAYHWMGDAGGIWAACRPDPRTDRFSVSQVWVRDWTPNFTMNPGPNLQIKNNLVLRPSSSAFIFDSQGSYQTSLLNLWSVNDPAFPYVQAPLAEAKAYYSDPDGVVRRGDGYRANIPEAKFSPARPATGDGCQFYHGNATVSPSSTLASPGTGSAMARRPVILNRPFRSVGEMGFAYRDQPFKTLDFWSSTSGDAALLDLFAVTDGPAVVAGKVNPTHAPAPVLEAVLAGASKNNETLGLRISTSDAQTLANRITAEIAANGPYGNRADLVSRLESPVVSAFDTSVSATANWANKAHAEAPARALADITDTRTWNLLIDVIAQTGRISANADSLDDFVVEGEKRYWLHVAIDRFTGEIVDQQLEAVYE